MGRHQIVEKLDSFLQRQPFTEECQALYLMAEIRKVLDHAYNKKTEFTLLRFYCDWVLHTEKDRHLENIAPIVEKIYQSAKSQIEASASSTGKPPLVDFLYMEDLRADLRDFFGKEGLTTELCTDAKFWVEFVKQVAAILADQPIINPTKEVRALKFSPAAPGCVNGEIYFTTPISSPDGKSYDFYTFANAY